MSSPFPWMIGRPGRRHAPLNVSDSCRLACRRWSGLPGFAIEMPLPCPSSKLASTYLLILDSTYCLSHVHGAFPCLPASASAQPSTWNALPWPSPPGVVEPTSLPSRGLRHPNRQLSHNHSCRHRARPFPVRGVSRALGKHLRTGGKSSLCLVIVIGISSSSGNSAVAGFRRLGLPRPWQDAGLWMCRCSPLSDDPFPLLCLLDAPLFLSHPHFYNADPVLAEAVLGLHPNQEEHSLFLDVHPVSLCLSTYGGGMGGISHRCLFGPLLCSPPLPGTELFHGGGGGRPGFPWH